MTTIKTWKERLENSPHLQACGAVGEAMQAEIDELRAESARLREVLNGAIDALDWLPTCECITCRVNSLWDRQQKAIDAARAALGEKS